MFHGRKNKKTSTTVAGSDSILNTCHFVASESGALRIQPLGTTLTSDQMSGIISRLSHSDCVEGLKEIVFDLSHVSMIGPRWTVVFAMIIDFARKVAAHCRLVALNDQPAAAAALFRRNAELMGLMTHFSD
ncbi:MAG: hypothetical protein JXQ75_00015 [Phycisphaerae bacterium]|nr:hypothetical protein [Phycisphaerae bacterium]